MVEINGIVYYKADNAMINAPDNRQLCPVCNRHIVKFYHTMWANQYGSERRYFCDCGAWFQVRKTCADVMYCVRKFPVISSAQKRV